MPFIRKFKTGSGATGVQVCWKRGGEVVRTVHVGSANSEVMLKKLLRRAERIKLGEGQSPMFDLKRFEVERRESEGLGQGKVGGAEVDLGVLEAAEPEVGGSDKAI